MKKINPHAGLGVIGVIMPIAMGIFFVIFGLFFGITATAHGAPFIFAIAGGFFAFIGVCVAVSSVLGAIKLKRKIQIGLSGQDLDMESFDGSLGDKLRSGTKVTIKDPDTSMKITVNPNIDDNLADNDNMFDPGFCTNCGTSVKDGFKFCPKCGNKI